MAETNCPTVYDDEPAIDAFRRQLADNQGLETAFNQLP